MGMEQDREARRAKVRAMIAARNAGTEPVRMTVPVFDVTPGDWVYRINPIRQYGDHGRVIIRGIEYENGDGARVATAEPHRHVSYLDPTINGTVDHGHTAFAIEGQGVPHKVPNHATVDIMRRVPTTDS